MTARQMRNLILATAAALLLIFMLPQPFAGQVAFIGGLTSLMMWWGGIWGSPKFVCAVRRTVSHERRVPEPHADVPARTFRYPIHLWRMRFGIGLMWIMSIGHALLAALLAAAWPGTPEERIATALVPTAAAWMFGRIAYATPRMQIDIDPLGIVSRQMFGTVRMAWDDIVVITRKDYFMNGVQCATNYQVYSREDVITIGEKLLDFSQLMDIVQANARFAIAVE